MTSRPPEWPRRLRDVCLVLAAQPTESIREEVWLLISSGLLRYLELHASRMGSVDRADLEDLASQKSLELFLRAESGQWNVAGRSGGEVAAFLSTVARNALLDHFQRRGREAPTEEVETPRPDVSPPIGADTPSSEVEGREFVDALADCADQLKARDRFVWFLRAFYDMASREIADHRRVKLKASHVDVILQRCRRAVRDCMSGKGFSLVEFPPGAFVALFDRMQTENWSAGETS